MRMFLKFQRWLNLKTKVEIKIEIEIEILSTGESWYLIARAEPFVVGAEQVLLLRLPVAFEWVVLCGYVVT